MMGEPSEIVACERHPHRRGADAAVSNLRMPNGTIVAASDGDSHRRFVNLLARLVYDAHRRAWQQAAA